MVWGTWVDHILHRGLGPLSAQDNPFVYPMVLGLIVASALIAALTAARGIRRGKVVASLFQQALLTALNLVFIYLFWLSYATPYGRLPFSPPVAGTAFVGIPLDGVYYVSAVLIHALLAFASAALLYGVIVSAQLDTESTTVQSLFTLALYVVLVAAWIGSGWPAWFVVPIEFLLSFVVGRQAEAYLTRFLHRRALRSPIKRRRVERSSRVLGALIIILLLALVLFLNPSAPIVLVLLGLYVCLVQIDDLLACVAAVIKPGMADYQFLSPRRWILTVPLTLGLATLGAAQVFPSLTGDPSQDYRLWLETAAAAVAYMLFFPLTDLARFNAGIRAERPNREEVYSTAMARAFAPLLAAFTDAARPAAMPARVAPAEGADGQVAPARSSMEDRQRVMQRALEMLSREPASPRVREREFKIFEVLSFPTGPIFLVTLLGFHLLSANSGISHLLDTSLVPLVFGLAAVVVGMLQLINSPELDATRNVFLLLLFLIVLVTALAAGFTVVPPPSQPLVFVGDPSALLGSAGFWNSAGRLISRALLLFVTIGQVAYLFKIVDTIVTLDQRESRDRPGEDWAQHANWLYQLDENDLAMSASDRALEFDDRNAVAWLVRSRVLAEGGDYPNAITAIERACAVEPDNAVMLGVKGYLLNEIGKHGDALTALMRAIELDRTNPLLYNNAGYSYLGLGMYKQAQVSFERAMALKPSQGVRDALENGMREVRKWEERAALAAGGSASGPEQGTSLPNP